VSESAQKFASLFRKAQTDADAALAATVKANLSAVDASDLKDLVGDLYWNQSVEPKTLVAAFGLTPHNVMLCVAHDRRQTLCALCFKAIVIHCVDLADGARVDAMTILCPECAPGVLDDARTAMLARRAAYASYLAALKAMPYRDYLKSGHWFAVRERTVERDGRACRICSSTERLNVHHRTYERRGEEALEDTITLCQPCHQLFHENGRLASPDTLTAKEDPSWVLDPKTMTLVPIDHGAF
jgi:5-methylcytosine-specific restriction endonuclease McrA